MPVDMYINSHVRMYCFSLFSITRDYVIISKKLISNPINLVHAKLNDIKEFNKACMTAFR